jgi:glycosyltransferase involved in cell wall biosynthesis
LEIPSIGISHGIYWDAPINYPAWMHAAKYARAILGSIEKCTRMVSVDTNTVNWVRATSLDRAARCLYIPNFVDLEQFRPVERIADSGRLTVLYPRRLYTPRGFWLISEILPDLLHD